MSDAPAYMRYVPLVLGAALLLAGTTGTATHDPLTNDHRECYEDEVILWSGGDNAHTHCVPIDDLPRMLWQECVALAEGGDASLQECDRLYGLHSY